MSQFGPIVPSFGPANARIFLLGMHPGREESEKLRPFVGASGYELRRMLDMVGVRLDDCYRANVFSRQPEGDNVALYGIPDPTPQTKPYGPLTGAPITYLDPRWLGELDRVHAEIAAVQPNIVIAMGNIACWALGLGQGINSIRGSIQVGHIVGLERPVKILPTIHPAALFRQWDQRVIILQDLDKAKDNANSPDFSFDNTELWLNPTLDDLEEFDREHMQGATECAADIETKRGQITAISFAPRPDISLAIPFWVEGDSPNYWPTVAEEAQAWSYPRRWVERADLVKVFQNGLYDLQYIPLLGIIPRACTEDTMLAHHGLYTELKKGLGFLGSIYANVPSWKSMRTFKKEEQLKRDD